MAKKQKPVVVFSTNADVDLEIQKVVSSVVAVTDHVRAAVTAACEGDSQEARALNSVLRTDRSLGELAAWHFWHAVSNAAEGENVAALGHVEKVRHTLHRIGIRVPALQARVSR